MSVLRANASEFVSFGHSIPMYSPISQLTLQHLRNCSMPGAHNPYLLRSNQVGFFPVAYRCMVYFFFGCGWTSPRLVDERIISWWVMLYQPRPFLVLVISVCRYDDDLTRICYWGRKKQHAIAILTFQKVVLSTKTSRKIFRFSNFVTLVPKTLLVGTLLRNKNKSKRYCLLCGFYFFPW